MDLITAIFPVILFLLIYYIDLETFKNIINLFYCRHQWEVIKENENNRILKCEKCNKHKEVNYNGKCKHKWEIISREEISNGAGSIQGKFIVLQCEKCGDTKDKTHRL